MGKYKGHGFEGTQILKRVTSDKVSAQLYKWIHYVLFCRDSPPHVPKEKLSTDVVINVIANMTHTIRQYFPNLSVYPALGNHDFWPQV